MTPRPLTRRRFLRRCVAVGGAALAGAHLAGCGSRGEDPELVRARIRALPADLACTDTAGLWPAEVKTRTDNEYVQPSTKPDRFCLNCNNFVPAAQPAACGTCRTVKGPIHPGGWCKAWAQRTS